MYVGLNWVYASEIPLVLNLGSGAITAQSHVLRDPLLFCYHLARIRDITVV